MPRMARGLFAKTDKTVDRLGYWFTFLDFVSKHWWQMLLATVGPISAAAAFITGVWRYIQMMAAELSPWIYLIFSIFTALALLGATTVAVLLIRWLSNQTWEGRDRGLQLTESAIRHVGEDCLRTSAEIRNAVIDAARERIHQNDYRQQEREPGAWLRERDLEKIREAQFKGRFSGALYARFQQLRQIGVEAPRFLTYSMGSGNLDMIVNYLSTVGTLLSENKLSEVKNLSDKDIFEMHGFTSSLIR